MILLLLAESSGYFHPVPPLSGEECKRVHCPVFLNPGVMRLVVGPEESAGSSSFASVVFLLPRLVFG